jgi:hypothetical protein
MRVYNVKGTSDDKPLISSNWSEAWEKCSNKKIPYGKIGGHVSSVSGAVGASETMYIAPISPSNNSDDNHLPLDVDYSDLVKYQDAKNN